MKILFYGASVTAQSKESSYFSMFENKVKDRNYVLKKVGFGGTCFDTAGFAFMQDIIDFKPDIVLVDWLTPRATTIDLEKLKTFFNSIVNYNIFPIWLHFPRSDDLQNKRKCYSQAKCFCQQHSIPFYELMHDHPEFESNVNIFLRDAVHTTIEGGVLYADFALRKIDSHLIDYNNSLKKIQASLNQEKLIFSEPILINCNKAKITTAKPLLLEFTVPPVCNNYERPQKLEMFLELKIGPEAGVIYVEVYSIETGKLTKSFESNPIDPWCYYERTMTIPLNRMDLLVQPGKYKLKMILKAQDPFEKIILKDENPKKNFSNDLRWTVVYRVSISALI